LDLEVPKIISDEPVIIGGQPQKEQYGDFQKEMDMFNLAFAEVMTEGDAKGRVFTFPIPTINITRDFDWDNSVSDKVFAMSAKYGIPYFSNFINSDMKPEDFRSMCLHPEEKIIVKEKGKIKRLTIGELVKKNVGNFDNEGWSKCSKKIEVLSLNPEACKIEWQKVLSFLKKKDKSIVQIITRDGKSFRVSKNHLIATYTKNGIETKEAKDVTIDDILLTTRSAVNCLSKTIQKIGKYRIDKEMAYFLGFFVADGNFLYDSRKQYSSYQKERGLQFAFHSKNFSLINRITGVVKEKFNYDLKFKQDSRYKNSLAAYFWNAEITRKLAENGLKKIGGVPEVIFDSPVEIIKDFLKGFFDGDGYERGQEIHIRDKRLAEDLVILYSLIGIPTTISYKPKSQNIRIQHVEGRGSKKGFVVKDILYNRVPHFITKKSSKLPLKKGNLVCLGSLEKYNLHTKESQKIFKSNLALVKVRSVEIERLKEDQVFYDIELAKNHYFVHSLGIISHNCCRLRLDNRELYKRGGGLFGAYPLTGSIGVVTVNMAKIGYLTKTKKQFFKKLARLMDLAKESLEIKRKTIEKFTEDELYPYCRHYLSDIKKHFGAYWRNHFSTVGLVGMNEGCLNFLGEDIGSEKGRKFALEVLDFMRDRLVKYQEETGHMYNLESSPAEGASYRLARIDKQNFPEIITAGKKEPYYTNSSQLPVDYTDDIFEALDLQDKLQCKYSGGTVFHGFIGEKMPSVEATKSLVKKVFSKYHLPYFTITPTFSICSEHGYISGEHFKCLQCGGSCEVYSRVVGYLRPVQQWNRGKQEEFEERKELKISNF
jgi:ribonucleoside-triphosphate reductase